MKIGNVNVKISPISLGVFGIFTLILLIYAFLSGDLQILVWGLPSALLLLFIPMALNYMSQDQYANLVPVYEKEAKAVRIHAINEAMFGQPVRIEGVVERVHFRIFNRPQYLVADKSGEISVKMFTSPQEDIKENDVVEVLGNIIKRYIVTGDPVINCISIRKKDK